MFDNNIYTYYNEDVETRIVKYQVQYSKDSNYGADIDGNRSTEKCFLDKIVLQGIYDENGNKIEVSEEEYEEIMHCLYKQG